MTNEMIKKLEDAGFRRWTKGNYDRLYASSEAKRLDIEYYKTGSIENATLDGEGISNNGARNCKDEKVYIDIATGKLETKGYNNYHDELMTAVEHTLNDAGFELTEDGEVVEKQEEEDMTRENLEAIATQAVEELRANCNATEIDIKPVVDKYELCKKHENKASMALWNMAADEPTEEKVYNAMYDLAYAIFCSGLRETNKAKYGHTSQDILSVDYDRDMEQYTITMYGGDQYDIFVRDMEEEDAIEAETKGEIWDYEENFARLMDIAVKREDN